MISSSTEDSTNAASSAADEKHVGSSNAAVAVPVQPNSTITVGTTELNTEPIMKADQPPGVTPITALAPKDDGTAAAPEKSSTDPSRGEEEPSPKKQTADQDKEDEDHDQHEDLSPQVPKNVVVLYSSLGPDRVRFFDDRLEILKLDDDTSATAAPAAEGHVSLNTSSNPAPLSIEVTRWWWQEQQQL
jgi:hypothetical protein